ncbi:MAG: TonB-dependent receptor [candidate division FCPU426 bacterium]
MIRSLNRVTGMAGIIAFTLLIVPALWAENEVPASGDTPVADAPTVTPAEVASPEASPTPSMPANADVAVTELAFFEDIMINVASQEAERLSEAPVITNVVTADQIRRMGARTINDVLLTLPGFSRIQDHNEYYSAERGIYGSSQQKILVLRDGHRLNSRCYSEANFGPAISLANIKRIEVMRGPGSTLYGDVALTAVINIVTLDGKDLQGGEITAGVGDHGMKKMDILAGSGDKNQDIMIFGSVYQADGEKRAVSASEDYASSPAAGEVVLDRFGDKPAYDVGFDYELQDLGVSYAHRYDVYTMPRAGGGGYGQLIDHEDFRQFEGMGVGSSSEFEHVEIKYQPTFGQIELTFRPYYDYFVFRDNEPQRRAGQSPALASEPQSYFMKWMERSYGAQAMGSLDYECYGNGRVQLGVQAEEMDMFESWDLHSPDSTHADWWLRNPEILTPGIETSYGVYGQIKHRFFDQLILNGGIRYDNKKRITGKTIDALSPRVALIYFPLREISARLSYGKSFVDSPYWYRHNNSGAGGYAGGPSLKPEFLECYQGSVSYKLPWGIEQTANVFYNDFKDVIFRGADAVYRNAGKIKTVGAEYELAWGLKGNLDIRLNYTYQNAFETVGVLADGCAVENVPKNMANIIADFAPLRHFVEQAWGKKIWLHVNVRYVGEQFAPWGKSPSYAGRDLGYYEPKAIITNLGVNLEKVLFDSVSIRCHVYNAFDARYRQGGSVNLPYEQPGRWALVQATYEW